MNNGKFIIFFIGLVIVIFVALMSDNNNNTTDTTYNNTSNVGTTTNSNTESNVSTSDNVAYAPPTNADFELISDYKCTDNIGQRGICGKLKNISGEKRSACISFDLYSSDSSNVGTATSCSYPAVLNIAPNETWSFTATSTNNTEFANYGEAKIESFY